jgi:hypothetical protein
VIAVWYAVLTWSPNLHKHLFTDLRRTRRRLDHQRRLLVIPRGSSGEVGLVFLPLRVGEVGSLVNVEGETQSAFEGTQVGSEGDG